ncbi:hypothetical protein [Halosimplex marinum]|uniref:hypothetical protein n=1 Tax=Halosimplex marinum TaxID=3396620 RepID=UPI003F54CD5E
MSALGRLLAVLCCLWVAVSAVATLWGRPSEALAFGSFCVAVAVLVPLVWELADPDPERQ